MPEPIVFYDLPGSTEAAQAWSPNTWKTRYCLNVKGIPYNTVWVEYTEIEALCKKIGADAADRRPDGSPLYTLPVIYDPNTKTAVADSAAIARYLDKTYPDTLALIPKETDAFHAAFQTAFMSTVLGSGDTAMIMMPASHDTMSEASRGYFRRTREARLGGKLEELAPAGTEKRAKHWEGMKKAWHAIAQWYSADGTDKLFFMGGDKPCYADVTIAAFIVWIRIVLGKDNKEWKDVLTWDGGKWARFMSAFEQYEAVDAGSLVEL